MQLTKPARDCTDSELDQVYEWHARRAPMPAAQPNTMPFSTRRYEAWQAAHAASEIDDEPEKRPHFVDRLIRDRPGILGGAALGICLFIALVVAVWPK